LFTLGKAQDDREAVEKSIEAFRSAITLSSLLGDHKMRANLKKNYEKAREYLGANTTASSKVRGAA